MRKGILIFVGLFLTYVNCWSQWIQTNGPYGHSDVVALFEHNSTLHASIFYSGNFSKSFHRNLWNLNSNIYFRNYTIKGDSLYASTNYFLTGLSRDLGIQLYDLNNLEDPPVNINPIRSVKAINHSKNHIYGGKEAYGFFRIDLDGGNLEYFNNGLPRDTFISQWGTYYEVDVTAVEVTNGFLYCGTNKGVYRSDLDLDSWVELNNGISTDEVGVILEIRDTLYASVGTYLYFSDNHGESWGTLLAANSRITSFVKNKELMLVGTSGEGVFRSMDNGKVWETMNSGLNRLSVNNILLVDSIIYCGTKGDGLFRYHNERWVDDNKGLISSNIRTMTVANGSIIANDNSRVFSLDLNGHWSNISPDVRFRHFGSIHALNDTVYMSIRYDNPRDSIFVLYSPDSGGEWNSLINPVPFIRDDTYRFLSHSNRLYVYEDDKLFYTEDLGINWIDLSLPSHYCGHIEKFEIYNSQSFIAACGKGEVLKLGAQNDWNLSNNGLPLDHTPDEIVYCEDAVFAYFDRHGMYVSFNNGINWSFANEGLDIDFITDFAFYGNHLFVASTHGVFVTNDYGQNWRKYNDGLKNTFTSSLEMVNDTLYVGTVGNGVWKRSIKDEILSNHEDQLSEDGFIMYPNPVSDLLTIKLATSGSEVIEVWDFMGRKVFSKSIVSLEKIDIGNLENGVYYVVLRSDDGVVSKTLLVSK